METNFKLGDVVEIQGYGGELFVIISIEKTYFRDSHVEEITEWYDCASKLTGEPFYAEEMDLTLKHRPNSLDFAELIYLQEQADEKAQKMGEELMEHLLEEGKIKRASEDVPQDNRVKIDVLLDELNDVETRIRMFGEHEDDERRDRRYSLQRAEIYAKLKEMTM